MKALDKYKAIILLAFITTSISITSCKNKSTDRIPEFCFNKSFPDSAINLSFANSKYDDYNSAAPGESNFHTLIFSTNRNSKGHDFNFTSYFLNIYNEYDDNLWNIYNDSTTTEFNPTEIINKINSSNNEFGPYILANEDIYDYYQKTDRSIKFGKINYMFFYTEEKNKNMNIRFINEERLSNNTHNTKISKIYDASILNTKEYNEGYLTYSKNKFYYCSDKAGKFDIYEMPIDTNYNLVEYLTKPYKNISRIVDNINSNEDDKCPFIEGKLMVFTSNRPGGYGGYDLWYSEKENNSWSTPKNFGPKINSKYDEYRPIFIKFRFQDFNLMIFSSNRPGGKGGYDLYFVKINNKDVIGIDEDLSDTILINQ